jgi:PAS domain S-box-containing protein
VNKDFESDISSTASAGRAGSSGSEALMRAIFPGDSEMAGRMRAFNWSASALGSTHDWPENLRVSIRLCLTSRFPICLWWARPLRFLYNDAFVPWLSDTKHPRALMELGRQVWSEDWHIIGPMLERVIATGDASWSEDVELYHNRKVPQEEVYITWSFTPILAADGRTVDGIFCPCSETTDKVIGARRLETLRKLAVRAGEARSVDGACDAAVAVMGENERDIPFAAIYVAGANGDDSRLSAAALPPGEHSLPSTVRASDDNAASPWPLARVLRTKRAADCLGIDARGVQLHAGPWRDLTQTALVVPIHAAQDDLAGLLVVGVSPRRPLDVAYRTFFDLVAGHIATAISGAQAYEAQRERAEALAQIDRAKTAFFSNVSHEFRTPLTLMLGPIEEKMLSRATGPLTIERAELDLVHRNTLRLLKLVNTLLDFSRIEAGRVQANYEAVDLPAYTAELASVFRAAIEKAGLRLSIDCSSLNGPVYVDRSMWEKIVLNLISNAFKFTFGGEIEVSLRRDDKFATLAVRDTGIGIEEDQLPRLFERFHRIEGARGRTYEGSGIGLALVQDLVKLHGGTVAVESIYGQGSIFRVAIPLGQAHLPAKQVGPKQVSTAVGANAFVEEALRWLPNQNGEGEGTKNEAEDEVRSIQSKVQNLKSKILIADDNGDMRQYLQRLLTPCFMVTAVADGVAALDAARKETPDLILADVMMPNLDGFGLLREVRDDPSLKDVPLVLLSARAGEEATIEGMQAGADDYLIKPFSARELLTRVAARLEIARMHRKALEQERKLRKLAEEAEDLIYLHELSGRLVTTVGLQPLLEEILDAMVKTLHADFGNVQLYDPKSGRLRIAAQRGFRQEFLDYFNGVCEGTLACGLALQRRERVIVEDVTLDPLFAPHLEIVAAAGFRAVQSTPLLSRSGEPLGVISTHFRQPHRPSERELRVVDLYARQAAETIERMHAEVALKTSEERFRLLIEGVADYAIVMLDPDGQVTSWNDGAERIKGYTEAEIIGQHFSRFYPPEEIAQGTPEELLALAAAAGRAEQEGWRLRKDGTPFWADTVITAIRGEAGNLIGFSKITRDLTDRRRAEEERRHSENYLAEAQRLSHTASWAWNASSGELYWSLEHYRICGLDPESIKPTKEMARQLIHPDDWSSAHQAFERAVRGQSHFECDLRIVRPDGTIRHVHSLAHPVFNEPGELIEYVGTTMDTTEQHEARAALEQAVEEIKTLKDRLYHENVALREEIDRTAMFEEIVGTSRGVRVVVSRIAKVAPTDSTVLVTGESGTGKELIARAIHKRSKRAGRPFIAFNCAGIPSTLIASELFGYEKGAFTGAQQRRSGRFELAEGGTIFLDEVGDLPVETQIALLRVLQEREFERVGGMQPIATDVRVIAASNQDLEDAIAAGTFRLDLFHRLNVFPIEVPPLRQRSEDIPLLMEYFIKRYAAKSGKAIKSVDKKTTQLFKSYSWPGNIRELQNVIERSVILCEREIFSVDESWLSKTALQPPRVSSTLAEILVEQEKKIIEAALAESRGRVAGRLGAASTLGIPSSTLESKIRALNIRKNRFK